MSFRILPAFRFFLYPTNRFVVNQSIRIPAARTQNLDVAGGDVYSMLWSSHRNYSRGVKRSGERPRNDAKNDAFALNKKIISFGKEGKWRDILQLADRENNQFNNVNWATAFSQLGKTRNLDCRDPLFISFVNGYADCLRDRGLEWAGIQGVANVVHAIGKKKLKILSAKSILAFVTEEENARKMVQEGNTQTVANVAWAFATLEVKSPTLFDGIEKSTDWLVEEGTPQAVANVAWAFATLEVKSPTLFDGIEKRADWLVQKGTPQAVANAAWAFATLEVKSLKLFAEIEKRADWLVHEGKPQHVANVAWALATLEFKSPKLFAAIENCANWLVMNGNAQEISNTAWAFATMEMKSTKLFAEIEKCADLLVQKGTPQAVANTVWAFATLDIKSLKLFGEVEKRGGWLVEKGTPQGVANTAWAFATLDIKCPKLLADIEKRADWLVTNGTPQNVANTAWAFATLKFKSPKLFAEIERRADWLVRKGKPQEVANTIWAVSQMQYLSPNLMRETNLRGKWLVKEGRAQEISNSALAFSKCGYNATTFFTAVVNNVSKLVEDEEPQHIINVCYAMAILDAMTILDLGKKHEDGICQLWDTAISQDPAMLTNEALRQLVQVFAFFTADGLKLQQPSALLTLKIGNVVQPTTKSKYQGGVAQVLGQLGLDFEEEVSPLEGKKFDNDMLSIDFACKSHGLAIEYDGEFHFLKEVGTGRVTRQENGATRAKRRFLQKSGWTVISIDYRDWIDAERKNCQLEFLSDRLYQAGIQL